MKGDITRNTFDPLKHFTHVLMQQGRVQLDADFNEQASILLHYIRTLASDIIGPFGGPAANLGFEIIVDPKKLSEDDRKRLKAMNMDKAASGADFLIGKGRYYVDGLLCENEYYAIYSSQPDATPGPLKSIAGPYLVYLEVHERHITCAEDDSIREVALGGPDTATRAKLIWQVKVLPLESGTGCGNIKPDWATLMNRWQPQNRGRLSARARMPADATDPCTVAPEASYRGAENQLYRVEIHRGTGAANIPPTFKWSRDNGSVVFPIRTLDGASVVLESLGRDARMGLKPGDWVEIVDDDVELNDIPGELRQVADVNVMDMRITLDGPVNRHYDENSKGHPILRRWDHAAGDPKRGGSKLDGGAAIIEAGTDTWITLEDGVQVRFEPNVVYLPGDYWLIPARTATGDVEWPRQNDQALPRYPHGIIRHYAPLGVISVHADNSVTLLADCRAGFAPLCYRYGYYGFGAAIGGDEL
ncbi:MAG: hypothetical protein JWQ98_1378 [Chlorobi bacterium]|nr:hypothetical protein [Chlorobiota bacterium]